MQDRGYELELTDEAKEFLIDKGANLDYGARPLRRALEQRIEDPLAEEILSGKFEGVNTIIVDVVKDDEDKVVRLAFHGEKRERPEEEEAVAVGGSEESSDGPSLDLEK